MEFQKVYTKMSNVKNPSQCLRGISFVTYLRFFCKKIGILISCSFGACGVGVTMPGNVFASGVTVLTGVTGAAGFTGVVILGDAP